jgi:pimeloyl-ACP methyl ester carboxylesterase
VALELYRQAPHRVKALVLANGTSRTPLESCFRSNFMHLLLPYMNKAYDSFPRVMNFLWSIQGRSPLTSTMVAWLGFNPNLANQTDVETYIQLVSRMDMKLTLQVLKTYEQHDSTALLGKIIVPTLIIAGEKDLIIPKEAQEMMHQLIPGSRFEVIRNGSHCPQMDIPELVNIIIERFFQSSLISEGSEKLESKSESKTSLQGVPSKP